MSFFFFFTAKPSANQIMNADSLQDDNMGNLYLHLFGHSGIYNCNLTLLLLSTTCPVLANSVDPDQLASEEANWSGSALFAIKYVNL